MYARGYPRKSRRIITYHGRQGYPVIHQDKHGRLYIMVRSQKGKSKKLYDGSQYRADGGMRILNLRGA